MKKILLLICVLLVGLSLQAVELQDINSHAYGDITRLVLSLSRSVRYTILYSPEKQSLKITMKQTRATGDIQEPIQGLSPVIQSSKFSQIGNSLVLELTGTQKLHYEHFTLRENGYKIVLDLYPAAMEETLQGQTKLAYFYAETENYVKSQKLFESLASEYPVDTVYNYYWGLSLLSQNNKEQAIEKFKAVKQGVPEFLMAQIELKNLGQPTLIVDAPKQPQHTKQGNWLNKQLSPLFTTESKLSFNLPTWLTTALALWIIIGLLLCILILAIFVVVLSVKVHNLKIQLCNIRNKNTVSILIDDDSKKKMVSRLVQNGWSNREISKELHISVKEVEAIIELCQVSDTE